MPQRFLVAVHYSEPTRNAKPSEVHYHKIDMGIAGCYDTSSGVGVVGRNAPEMKKRKTGVSWIWLIALGALAVWGISYGPDWFMKHVLHRIKPGTQKEVRPVTKEQKEGGELVERMARNIPLPKPTVGTYQPEQTTLAQAPYITGVAKYGTKWRIDLSDGRVFTDETGGVVAAGRDFIRLTTGEIVFRRNSKVARPDNTIRKTNQTNEPK